MDMGDSVPIKSSATFPSPAKRKSVEVGHLSLDEKQCIINLYKQLKTIEPHMKMTTIVTKIVDTVGVSQSTVYRTIKEYKNTGNVAKSKHFGGRPGILSTCGEGVKESVREIIQSFFYKNESPSLDKLLTEINNRPDLPKMSRSSLYTYLKQTNLNMHEMKP